MATLQEIEESVAVARAAGCRDLALLHCVSGYPAPSEDYNVATLPDLRRRFGVEVGLSDHTLSEITAIASVALSATIIEKHFTLDRQGGGPDDAFSLEPEEFRALCDSTRTAWAAVGRVDYERKRSEAPNLKFRRSLYFVRALRMGERISVGDVKSIRPGFGLAPKYLPEVIGKRVLTAVDHGVPVDWSKIGE